MTTCGGCKESFQELPMRPPYNYCLAHNEIRLMRGEREPHGKRRKVMVHYHIRRSCLKRTNFAEDNIIFPVESSLKEEHLKYFKSYGIDLSPFI